MSKVQAAVEMRSVKIREIRIDEDVNPRRDVDKTALADLTASIRECGILQPLLVEPSNGGGVPYRLVAGKRRLLAAKAAKLGEVPVVVRETGKRGLEFSIVENLKRCDFSPLEEAEAFDRLMKQLGLTQKAVAAKLQVSPQLISDRLRILGLPQPVQDLIGNGVVPTGVVKVLAKIAKASSPLAEAVALALAAGDVDAAEFVNNPNWLVGDVIREAAEEGVWLATPAEYNMLLRDRTLPGAAGAREELVKELGGSEGAGLDTVRIPWQNELDAARAFDCLLELGSGGWGSKFICDEDFVQERVRAAIVAYVAQKEQQGSGKSKSDVVGRDGQDAEARRADVLKRKERKAAAQAANVEFGARLAKKYREVPASADAVRLAVVLALGGSVDEVAGTGLRLTHKDWQSIERKTLKNGKTTEKVVLEDRNGAGERLVDWVLSAKTAEAILGRFTQAITSAARANGEALAQSNRVYWSVPVSYGDGANARLAGEAQRLIDKFAKPALVEGLEPKES